MVTYKRKIVVHKKLVLYFIVTTDAYFSQKQHIALRTCNNTIINVKKSHTCTYSVHYTVLIFLITPMMTPIIYVAIVSGK